MLPSDAFCLAVVACTTVACTDHVHHLCHARSHWVPRHCPGLPPPSRPLLDNSDLRAPVRTSSWSTPSTTAVATSSRSLVRAPSSVANQLRAASSSPSPLERLIAEPATCAGSEQWPARGSANLLGSATGPPPPQPVTVDLAHQPASSRADEAGGGGEPITTAPRRAGIHRPPQYLLSPNASRNPSGLDQGRDLIDDVQPRVGDRHLGRQLLCSANAAWARRSAVSGLPVAASAETSAIVRSAWARGRVDLADRGEHGQGVDRLDRST